MFRILIPFALLTGCAVQVPDSGIESAPHLVDALGQCYGRTTTPAQVQTVTRQQLVAPAQLDADGQVIAPARYQSVTTQQIVQERRVVEYQTPCAETFTPEFITSLQRALAARGLFSGAVTGVLTPETGAAIRAFQRDFGPDSPVLSMEAAQRLGLLALSREQIKRLDSGPGADPFSAQP